jgi:hypothetical protein
MYFMECKRLTPHWTVDSGQAKVPVLSPAHVCRPINARATRPVYMLRLNIVGDAFESDISEPLCVLVNRYMMERMIVMRCPNEETGRMK